MHRNIKQGSGSDVRSPVYAELGTLRHKPRGLGRNRSLRGEKQRIKGGLRARHGQSR